MQDIYSKWVETIAVHDEPRGVGSKVYAEIPCCTHKEAGVFVKADLPQTQYQWISVDTGLRYKWSEISAGGEPKVLERRNS